MNRSRDFDEHIKFMQRIALAIMPNTEDAALPDEDQLVAGANDLRKGLNDQYGLVTELRENNRRLHKVIAERDIAEATVDRYKVALEACLRGDLTLVMDGPTPGIGFDYSYVPATKEVMTTLAEVNRVLTGTEPVERDATHNLPSKDDTH